MADDPKALRARWKTPAFAKHEAAAHRFLTRAGKQADLAKVPRTAEGRVDLRGYARRPGLHAWSFDGRRIASIDFSHAVLPALDLTRAELDDVVFSSTTLEQSRSWSATVVDTAFENVRFGHPLGGIWRTGPRPRFTRCRFVLCRFAHPVLRDAVLEDCTFVNCRFRGSFWATALERCVFERCHFEAIGFDRLNPGEVLHQRTRAGRGSGRSPHEGSLADVEFRSCTFGWPPGCGGGISLTNVRATGDDPMLAVDRDYPALVVALLRELSAVAPAEALGALRNQQLILAKNPDDQTALLTRRSLPVPAPWDERAWEFSTRWIADRAGRAESDPPNPAGRSSASTRSARATTKKDARARSSAPPKKRTKTKKKAR